MGVQTGERYGSTGEMCCRVLGIRSARKGALPDHEEYGKLSAKGFPNALLTNAGSTIGTISVDGAAPLTSAAQRLLHGFRSTQQYE